MNNRVKGERFVSGAFGKNYTKTRKERFNKISGGNGFLRQTFVLWPKNGLKYIFEKG